jgi:glucose-6-phosphate 1-dehydrogenase
MLKRVPLIDAGREHRILRFTNSFLEPIWNRNYVESMQITMAEDFGVQGGGSFYDQTGYPRCFTDQP